jgi:transcriptional regulator with XRE-family HTH domain
MELSDYIKQIRLRHGLTQREFARRLGISPMHVSVIETPFDISHRLPSDELLKKIARVFSESEDERIEIEKRLLLERAKLLAAPEIRDMLGPETTYSVNVPIEGMPDEFIERLKKDMSKKNFTYDFYKDANITPELLEAVLSGKAPLSRKQVISIAIALGEPVEEYLEAAGYIPDIIKEFIDKNSVLGLFRRLKDIPAEDIDEVIDVIVKILDLHKKHSK